MHPTLAELRMEMAGDSQDYVNAKAEFVPSRFSAGEDFTTTDELFEQIAFELGVSELTLSRLAQGDL